MFINTSTCFTYSKYGDVSCMFVNALAHERDGLYKCEITCKCLSPSTSRKLEAHPGYSYDDPSHNFPIWFFRTSCRSGCYMAIYTFSRDFIPQIHPGDDWFSYQIAIYNIYVTWLQLMWFYDGDTSYPHQVSIMDRLYLEINHTWLNYVSLLINNELHVSID